MSLTTAAGLAEIDRLAALDHHLAVLATTAPDRPDPDISVVNAALTPHPVHGAPVVALVGRRGRKLANLRVRPRATLVFRAGWEWVAVRGPVELIGPDDERPDIDPGTRRRLLRDIYAAAGGQHDDLEQYDRAMAAERRCAVLVTPEHLWTNPPGSEHRAP